MSTSRQPVVVYGTEWCRDTKATRAQLDRLGVAYRYVDIDSDAAGDAWVKEHNAGKRKMPTLDVGGTILSIPDEQALSAALRTTGTLG